MARFRLLKLRAKEIRRIAEKLITLAVKEKDNFDEVTVTARLLRRILMARE